MEENGKILWESNSYLITHYDVDSLRLVVVFISAGGGALAGGRIEEFKKSLSQMSVSLVFVEDKHRWWYNHPDTGDMFLALAAFATEYLYVGVLGESMGGCGAILSTNYIPNINRVLSLSPQFSILSPFILFDVDNRVHENRIDRHYYLNFAGSPFKDKCQLIFGNCQWQDYIHRAMYAAHGFSISVVDGGNHGVAAHMKHHNRLVPLLERFCNFSEVFDAAAIVEALGSHWVTDNLLSVEHRNPPTDNQRYF